MKISLSALLFFLVAGTTGQVLGVSIPVTNAGFETPSLADGSFQYDIDGWSLFGGTVSAGVYNPTTTDFPSEAPQGQNIAFVNNSGSLNYIEQVLFGAGNIIPGLTYTLEVDVGRRSGLGYPSLSVGDYAVTLFAYSAGGIYNQVAGEGNLTPELGTFATSTLTWTADATYAGEPLVIRLYNYSSAQINFDNVRLTAVPLPAAALLFGSGLLGLIGIGRRKKVA